VAIAGRTGTTPTCAVFQNAMATTAVLHQIGIRTRTEIRIVEGTTTTTTTTLDPTRNQATTTTTTTGKGTTHRGTTETPMLKTLFVSTVAKRATRNKIAETTRAITKSYRSQR